MPAATIRFSIAALLVLTACVAFVASILNLSLHTEPSAPHLIVKTLPYPGNSPFVDSLDGTPLITHAEMARLTEKRMSSIHQSLAEAIENALGDGTDDVVVSRVSRSSPTETLAVDATWGGSSTTRNLKLQRIKSNRYRVSVLSPDGSLDLVLTLDTTGTFLDDEPDSCSSR